MSAHATQGGAPEPPRNWMMGAEAFERRMPHHDGIQALWETKWKVPCSQSVYPFHDGAYEDFAPIFQELIEKNINDATAPAYTEAFLPTARRLAAAADAAAALNKAGDAIALYLRACAVYRIARFPYVASFPRVSDAAKWRAWEEQKATYLRAGRLWEAGRLEEVVVGHRWRAGRDGEGGIPVYVRVPAQGWMSEKGQGKGRGRDPGEGQGNGLVGSEASSEAGSGSGSDSGFGSGGVEGMAKGRGKVPVVLLMTGLDGYRPDNTVRCEEFLKRGWASVVVEIPGTADCPADSADPEAPDRLWTSVLDWMAEDGRFDMARVVVWGLSSGGYYAVRIAHTHRERLAGCVAQGAGCHYFFDREWLDRADGHEYPFQLLPAMAMKHGFASVDEYKAKAQKKFSLLETGILDKPATRLLLINGTHDGLMPIEDSLLVFEHGTPKEARFFSGALHMGYPMANASVYPWIEQVMASVRG